MKPVAILILLLLATLLNQGAWAMGDIAIGDPELKGTGCPTGTARAVLSPDGSAISILFDEFMLEIKRKQEYPESQIKRTCYFKIPVSAPPGFMIEASRIDYRGYAQFTKQTTAYLTTAGPILNPMQNDVTVRPKITRIPPGDDVFTISHTIKPNYHTAKCKKGKTLEFSTEIKFVGPLINRPNFIMEEALLVIDSADIANEGDIQIGIRLKECD
ncbi:MAG: DUF4360 domain-containing protein [Pseudobdellovibrionaceae bacterium]